MSGSKSDETSFLFKGRLGHWIVIPFCAQLFAALLVNELDSSRLVLFMAQSVVFGTAFVLGALKRRLERAVLLSVWPAAAMAGFNLYEKLDMYGPQRPIIALTGPRYWLASYVLLCGAVAVGGWRSGRSVLRDPAQVAAERAARELRRREERAARSARAKGKR